MVSKTKERRKSGINTSEPLAGDVGNLSNLSDTEKLKALWLKECHKFTYDPFEKSLDFRNRRPMDYKLNNRVMLPKPLDDTQEFLCEIKRRGFNEAYDSFESDSDGNSLKSTTSAHKKEPQDPTNRHNMFQDTDGTTRERPEALCHREKPVTRVDVNIVKKNKREFVGKRQTYKGIGSMRQRNNEPIKNLSKNEQLGLNSLLKRLKKNEIKITLTDKSGIFAILIQDQYLKSGQIHTSKDENIGWKEVNYLRNQLNNHMFWLRRIFKYCEKTNPDRMNTN